MINYALHTRLKGAIVLTDAFHADPALGRDRSLYKFIWVRSGTLHLEIDHVETTLEAGEVVPLTPLHRIAVREVAGDYLTLLFNSNFYCIYGHDDEVSCNGLLFNGGPETVRLRPDAARTAALYEIADKLAGEYAIEDSLREEMLRILLKRFIITCTRLARERFAVAPGKEKAFDIVRQYYVLVDEHFREKKQVQEYADLLNRSPKTLSNLFAAYGLPSPLRVIHERTGASCGKGTQTGYKTVNPERAPGTIPRAPRDEPAIRKSMISGNARYCICTSSRRSKPSTTDPLLTYK